MKDEIQDTIQIRIRQSYNKPNSDNCKYGIGNVYINSIFIIGEVSANPDNLFEIHKCWTNEQKNKSPYFLHSALNETNTPFSFYLTNAKKTHFITLDREILEKEIETLKPNKIFILGNAAEKMIKSMMPDLKYTKVPHPSYIRRFNLMNAKEYSKYFL